MILKRKKLKRHVIIITCFVFVSVFLCVIFILNDRQDHLRELRLKREELSYLSSMMKVLGKAIENGDTDNIILTSTMIERSGALSYLSINNREYATEFVNILAEGGIYNKKACVYARRCSAAALYELSGEIYDIGRYSLQGKSEESKLSFFEYKRQIAEAKKSIGGDISFRQAPVGDAVCFWRSNVYYRKRTDSDTACESVYYRRGNGYKNDTPKLSSDEAIGVIKEKDFIEDITSAELLFYDEGIYFFMCQNNEGAYLLGIDEEYRELSHYKKIE